MSDEGKVGAVDGRKEAVGGRGGKIENVKGECHEGLAKRGREKRSPTRKVQDMLYPRRHNGNKWILPMEHQRVPETRSLRRIYVMPLPCPTIATPHPTSSVCRVRCHVPESELREWPFAFVRRLDSYARELNMESKRSEWYGMFSECSQ